jgi:hypothetical protein
MKRTNLRIHSEEGAEIQIKGIGKLFNIIIAENFPTLCNTDTNLQKDMNRKEQPYIIPYLYAQNRD